jgi:hypothetical protein
VKFAELAISVRALAWDWVLFLPLFFFSSSSRARAGCGGVGLASSSSFHWNRLLGPRDTLDSLCLISGPSLDLYLVLIRRRDGTIVYS